jgi:very-short-patch-repair endonuclease
VRFEGIGISWRLSGGLRANMTLAERALWDKLRAKQFMGLKFRDNTASAASSPIFSVRPRKLVIEVDGEIHDDPNQAFHNIGIEQNISKN